MKYKKILKVHMGSLMSDLEGLMIRIGMGILLYCAQLCVYLMGGRAFFELKMKKKWILLITSVIFIMVALGIAKTEKQYDGVFLAIYICAAMVSMCLYEGKVVKKMFAILSILCISACTDEIFGILLQYLTRISVGNDEIYDIFEAVLTVGLFTIIWKSKQILMLNKDKIIEMMKNAVAIVVIWMSICQMLAIGGLAIAKRYIPEEQPKRLFDVLSILGLIGIIGIVLFIVYIKKTNEKMEQLLVAERELKKMQEQYYKVLLEKETDTRRYRHDMNNHFLCLYELAEDNNVEELKTYINEMKNNFSLLQRKCYMTGNNILDILLNYHLSGLNHIEVSVAGQCSKELKISNMELCTVFSNILKNAVEEVERLLEGEKHIKVKILQRNRCVVINVKNSSNLVKKSVDDHIKTVKKDKDNHGIGLKNIMETVERNDGSFVLTGDGKEAVAELILPCK